MSITLQTDLRVNGESLKDTIPRIQSQINMLNTKVEDLRREFYTIQAQINNNRSTISYQSDIEANLHQLTNDFKVLSQEVSNLTAKVNMLERQLSQQLRPAMDEVFVIPNQKCGLEISEPNITIDEMFKNSLQTISELSEYINKLD